MSEGKAGRPKTKMRVDAEAKISKCLESADSGGWDNQKTKAKLSECKEKIGATDAMFAAAFRSVTGGQGFREYFASAAA